MLPAEDIRLLLTIIMASVITIPIPAAVIAFIITTTIIMRGACIRLTAETTIILTHPHVAILPLRAVAEVLHPAVVVEVASAVLAAEIN